MAQTMRKMWRKKNCLELGLASKRKTIWTVRTKDVRNGGTGTDRGDTNRQNELEKNAIKTKLFRKDCRTQPLATINGWSVDMLRTVLAITTTVGRPSSNTLSSSVFLIMHKHTYLFILTCFGFGLRISTNLSAFVFVSGLVLAII